MNKDFLSKIAKSDLYEFTQICYNLFNINKDSFINEILLLYKWHNNNGIIPEKIKFLQDQWYNSLKINYNKYDYSVYDDVYY